MEDHCLFFDGASKGNPSIVGVGGILLNPNGNITLRFAWGLGQEPNNKVEALALWQGIRLALSQNIRSLTVFGDSRIIMQSVATRKPPIQVHITLLVKKIRAMIVKFQNFKIYHILRSLNGLADYQANSGTLLSRGYLVVDGTTTWCSVP